MPPSLPKYIRTLPDGSFTNAIAWLSTCGKPGIPGEFGITEAQVVPELVDRITHSGFPLPSNTEDPPRKTVPACNGSTFATLSYQHCCRQISGAPVWVQVLPPSDVKNTPRFVLDAVLESAIEA